VNFFAIKRLRPNYSSRRQQILARYVNGFRSRSEDKAKKKPIGKVPER
jgi:hypothetical protein